MTTAPSALAPLTHFWSVCVGAGRAAEGLRAGWREQLRQAHEQAGFEYVRFHGLFHDDMFVYELVDGTPHYNFQYIDDLFDALLEMGVRPFVEFGFSPRDLARETETVFWWKGHGAPPTDVAAWADLISTTIRHWQDRYGAEEIRQWYYEVWNEPNLHPFFRGTRTEYYELYKATAAAVKSVDPALRIGGPATSNFVPDARFDGETEDLAEHALVRNADHVGRLDELDWQPVWVVDFLDWCAREGVPVDFVSSHPYPTDWPLDEHGAGLRLTRGRDATPTDIRTLRRIVAESAFPAAEIHLTEWSSSSSSRDSTHDYLQAATFVVRCVLHSLDQIDSLSYWTFTDVFEEAGAGAGAFHGGFGMFTYQGIPKPVFTAYRFLHALGDELLHWDDAVVITRHSITGVHTVLAYNYPDEEHRSVPASWDGTAQADTTLSIGSPCALTLPALLPSNAVFDVQRLDRDHGPGGEPISPLDRDHGDVHRAWREIGSPASPTRSQVAALRHVAGTLDDESVTTDADGALPQLTIPAWGIVLLTEHPTSNKGH